ncbi:SIMPL domain-containing protein [Tumidithrix helvetica PCC 7403]|uniref:SIMPL domain-containing protein n=1 Tax=Tumidithrix helvetica TaxID=3457545 RepID=UPI003CBB3422
MEHGVLRISETVTTEIEAVRAFVIVHVTSEKVIFGNAAIAASEDLKTAIERIKKVCESIEIDTESVSFQSNSGIFGKNSTAEYTVKLRVDALEKLGEILGICAEGKKITIRSLVWDYDEEQRKLDSIVQAMQKAKNKADRMMEAIGYSVVGIRSCSDSYSLPAIGEIFFGTQSAPEHAMTRAKKAVDFGTQIKSKKQISATCSVEFLVNVNSG